MSTSPQEISEEVLKLVSHCPVCERAAHGVDVRVLRVEGDTHTLHVTCRRCRTASLAMVVAAPPALTAVSVMTDVTAEDVQRLLRQGPVSVNDVIDMHAWIEGKGWKKLVSQAVHPRRTPARTQSKGRRIDK